MWLVDHHHWARALARSSTTTSVFAPGCTLNNWCHTMAVQSCRERERNGLHPLYTSSSRNMSFKRAIQLASGKVKVKPFLILKAFNFLFLWLHFMMSVLADGSLWFNSSFYLMPYLYFCHPVCWADVSKLFSVRFLLYMNRSGQYNSNSFEFGSRLHFTNDNQCIKVFK